MTTEPPAGAISAVGSEIESMASLPPRLLRLPEVISRVGLRRSAIYQRMSEGRFPKCRSLGPKCSVWVEAEINAWIKSVSQCIDDA
jgi:prophage regulatory protein